MNRVQYARGDRLELLIQAGGAVGLVRGTTFALIGAVTIAWANIVVMACWDDCSPATHVCGLFPGAVRGIRRDHQRGKG